MSQMLRQRFGNGISKGSREEGNFTTAQLRKMIDEEVD